MRLFIAAYAAGILCTLVDERLSSFATIDVVQFWALAFTVDRDPVLTAFMVEPDHKLIPLMIK